MSGRTSRVTGEVPNFVGGVSQQPAALRRSNTVDEMVNFVPTAQRGALKRPGTQHKFPFDGAPDNAYIHTVDRDPNERYVVFASSSGVRVFDLITGTERTVTVEGAALNYLSGAAPYTDIELYTVADYTFILNRRKTVTMAATRSPARPYEGLWYLRASNYGRTYTLYINGQAVAIHGTPSGNDSAHVFTLRTSQITKKLLANTSGGTLIGGGFNTSPYKSVLVNDTAIYIRNNSVDFQIASSDGDGNNNLITAKNSIQDFSDLPLHGYPGIVLQVTNNQANNYDNYWVKFKADGTPADALAPAVADENVAHSVMHCKGVWVETVKPDIPIALDPTTMPHILVSNGDGTFTFKQASWGERAAGDEESAPNPSFVGSKINALFWYKNRLCLLSDENINMSRAGEPFEFFPTTVTTVLDSDPIDIAQTTEKIAILKQAAPVADLLLIFAARDQFALLQNQLLTPKDVRITAATNYEVDTFYRPVPIDQSLIFVKKLGNYLALSEIRAADQSDLTEAWEITQHVPSYIPATVTQIIAAPSESMVFALDGPNSTIYCYRFERQDNQLAQAAWFKWTIEGSEIKRLAVVDNELILYSKRGTALYKETIPLAVDYLTTQAAGYPILLDQLKMLNNGVYNAAADETTFTLPYAAPANIQAVQGYVDGMSEPAPHGSLWAVKSILGATVTLTGNASSTPIWFGRPFNAAITVSEFLLRNNEGQVSNIGGRLQILAADLRYERTSHFKITMTKDGRTTPYVWEYWNNYGVPTQNVNKVGRLSGSYRFTILSKSDQYQLQISSNHYLPVELISLRWDGIYSPRKTCN